MKTTTKLFIIESVAEDHEAAREELAGALEDARDSNIAQMEIVGEGQALTRAQICDGTGFKRGARFVQIGGDRS